MFGDVYKLDFSSDGIYLFAYTYEQSYENQVLQRDGNGNYVSWQQFRSINFGYSGFMTDDHQWVGESSTNGQIFFHKYHSIDAEYQEEYDIGSFNNIRDIVVCSDYSYLVVGEYSQTVSILKFNSTHYESFQTLTVNYTTNFQRMVSITDDHLHIVVNHPVQVAVASPTYGASIYEFSNSNNNFTGPLVTAKFNYVTYYSSLSLSKKYWAVSTTNYTYIFQDPLLSNKTLIQS